MSLSPGDALLGRCFQKDVKWAVALAPPHLLSCLITETQAVMSLKL